MPHRFFDKFYLMMATPMLLGFLGIVIKLVSMLAHMHTGAKLMCSQIGIFFRDRAYMSTVVFVVFLCYNPLCTSVRPATV